MSFSKDRPRRPSFPSPPDCALTAPARKVAASHGGYLDGLMGALDFLRSTRANLRDQAAEAVHSRQLWYAAFQTLHEQPADFRDGFLDVVALYLQLTLEGCQIDLDHWNPVHTIGTVN